MQIASTVANISTSTEKDQSSMSIYNNNKLTTYKLIMNPSELNSSSMSHQKIKIVLLGDSGVGKSSLIDRFVKGQIDNYHQPTVGIDFLTRNIVHNGKTFKLQLWDTAGQQKYKSLVPAYLRDANCAVLVFQNGRKQTFENLRNWLSLVRDHAPASIAIIIVGNKSDIVELSKCGYEEEVRRFGVEERLKVVGASAKSGHNVDVIFEVLVLQLEGSQKEGGEEEKVVSEFFLRYNRVNFDYGRKLRCCHI